MTDIQSEELNFRYGISSDALKIIAILAMFIDHIGSIIFEKYIMLLPNSTRSEHEYVMSLYYVDVVIRAIGRIAFPIFAYQIVVGFYKTSNRIKYGLNLLIFALISEIPYELGFDESYSHPGCHNVFFTLLLGYLAIVIIDYFRNTNNSILLQILTIIICSGAAFLLDTDYGLKGVAFIICVYYLYSRPALMITVAPVVYVIAYFLSDVCIEGMSIQNFFSDLSIKIYMVLAMPLIFADNGKRSLNKVGKYFCYAFYPAHIMALLFIRHLILGV